jgi:hypothetical protein
MSRQMEGSSSVYSVHPGVVMVQDWIAALPEKTGRSLGQWLTLIKKEAPADESGRRDWLKKAHGLGTNSAWWLAERSVGKGGEEDTPEGYLRTAESYVEAMFSGRKAALRPLYDQLLALGLKTGKDAKACPCKTIVPLYRTHVFAQIKPATITRLDLGLALGKMKTPARLIDTGGYEKKDRITHRIEIASAADIDADVKRWLKTAYDLDE